MCVGFVPLRFFAVTTLSAFYLLSLPLYVQVAALCIFADVINFCGDEAGRMYSAIYLPAALLAVCPPADALTEDDLFAVSGAAYGIGKQPCLTFHGNSDSCVRTPSRYLCSRKCPGLYEHTWMILRRCVVLVLLPLSSLHAPY